MFNTQQTSSHNSHAIIRDNALILSLETAETPLVARFDLDSLAQANFIVQNFDGIYHLNLRDFSGQVQAIAQFNSKIEAHQALHYILHALVNHSTDTATTQPPKRSLLGRLISFVLQLCGVVFILLVLYGVYIYHFHRDRLLPLTPVTVQQPAPEITLPEGEAQDIDQLLESTPKQETTSAQPAPETESFQ